MMCNKRVTKGDFICRAVAKVEGGMKEIDKGVFRNRWLCMVLYSF